MNHHASITETFASGLTSEELSRNAGIIAAYGMETYRRIRGAKVLLVGSGGIGCELIKNMSMMGFCNGKFVIGDQ